MKTTIKTSSKKRKQNKNGLSIVEGIPDLKKLINDGYCEYRILLAGGAVFSRKEIRFNKKLKRFYILNWIDNSEQKLTEKELLDEKFTNIGEALKKRALIVDLNENNKNICN